MTQTELVAELMFVREVCKDMSVKKASKLINQRRKYLKELKEMIKLLEEIKDIK